MTSGGQEQPRSERGASRLRAHVQDLRFRAKRRIEKRFSDVELRQLRSLQRAYAGDTGPELLVFGDSAMFWTLPTDDDRRHLVDMIRDELGDDVRFEALVGPGYNPRIVSAFLSSLTTAASRPKVVLVPTSVLMAHTIWLQHPRLSYELVGAEIRRAAKDPAVKRIQRPDPMDFEEFDRLPAPSLRGSRLTAGELRMFLNAKPESRWQQAVRTRHLLDYYNAERLEPDSIGIQLVGQLAAYLAELNLPSVAYIAPINDEILAKALGPGAVEHVRRNADLIETIYLKNSGGSGVVVNAAMDNPAAHFSDPVHLNDRGRRMLAGRIAEAARPFLHPGPEATS